MTYAWKGAFLFHKKVSDAFLDNLVAFSVGLYLIASSIFGIDLCSNHTIYLKKKKISQCQLFSGGIRVQTYFRRKTHEIELVDKFLMYNT